MTLGKHESCEGAILGCSAELEQREGWLSLVIYSMVERFPTNFAPAPPQAFYGVLLQLH